MPMSTQRFSRQAWQCRRLSLVILQSPLKGQVNIAFLFMLLLERKGTETIPGQTTTVGTVQEQNLKHKPSSLGSKLLRGCWQHL